MSLADDLRAEVHRRAGVELAKASLWHYCQVMAPDFYLDDRPHLRVLCDELQTFYESPTERVCVVNMPPRHGKSRTAALFVEWVMGRNLRTQVITASYNEELSTTFAKTVRNTIAEAKVDRGVTVYSDIFPKTRIKSGEATMKLWSLEGAGHHSYLATSPTGTATGFGANLILCDDLIKNAEEAYNDRRLGQLWSFFTDTLLSRREPGQKIVFIMTRWASGDVAGRALAHFESIGIPVRQVMFRALQEDGTMLCPPILSREDYDIMLKTQDPGIVRANYDQRPIDEQGRLYSKGFKTYSQMASYQEVKGYCDTADTGEDLLCSIVYGIVDEGTVHVLDVVYSQDPMEITTPMVVESYAQTYNDVPVSVATIESNNGGRGFRRDVQRLCEERGCWTVFTDRPQTANKIARILTGAPWLLEHVYMPEDWASRWPRFFEDVVHFKRQGKNAHDDAPDALTGIYDIETTMGSGFNIGGW